MGEQNKARSAGVRLAQYAAIRSNRRTHGETEIHSLTSARQWLSTASGTTLPAEEAALLAEVVAGWLDPDAEMFMQFPPIIIANLARGGQPTAGLLVARALFQVFWRDGRGRHIVRPVHVRTFLARCNKGTRGRRRDSHDRPVVRTCVYRKP